MNELTTLGDPAIDIGGFRIWIHKREFPDAKDFWDANWVEATASCTDEDGTATARGPIIHLSEITEWLEAMARVYKNLSGEAKLQCVEPNLSVVLAGDKLGHVKMDVAITPDGISPPRAFTIRFDQTRLRDLIAACHKILEEYPIRFPLA